LYENASDDETIVHSNQKHSLSYAPYIRYGMVSRKLQFWKTGNLSCIILCKGWPSWFWVAKARQMEVKRLILATVQWKPLVRALYPATDVFVWSELGDLTWPRVDFVMSDYDLKGVKLNSLWSYTLKYIILLKASRSPPASWVYSKFNLNHSDCGGVTTGSWHIHLYSSSAAPMPPSMLPQPKQDASTILDATAMGGHSVNAPIPLNATKAPNYLNLSSMGAWH
jgi:hypothetical protein